MTIQFKGVDFEHPPASLDPIERKAWSDERVDSLSRDTKQVFSELVHAFEEFKRSNDRRLDDLERKQGDVLNDIQTETINQTVSELQDRLGNLETELQVAEMDRKANEVGEIAATVDGLAAQVADLTAAVEAPVLSETPPESEIVVAGQRPARRLSPMMVQHARKFAGWLRSGVFEGRETKELSTFPETKAMAVGSDPDGGYTVIPMIDQNVTRFLSQISDIRAIATVQPISTGSYRKTHITSGASSGWVSEQQTRAVTTAPQLAELDFPTHELYAMPSVTQTLLDDSFVNIEELISRELATKFAEEEGSAFVTGDGVGKPQGFLGTAKVANASWAWGSIGYVVSGASGNFQHDTDASPPIVGADALINLVYSLKSGYRNTGLTQEFGTNQGGDGARFVMNRTTEGGVRKIKDANGQYIWQIGAQPGAPALVLGYPVTNVEDMPDYTTADAYAIAFGNFRRGYLIVERIGIRVLRDPYTSKPYVLFYATKRVGGGVQDFEAIKLLKMGTS